MTKPTIKAKSSVADNTAAKQRDHLRQFCFKPGQSGNSAGRPKGSRSKVSEAFIAALHADFAEHGVAVIATVRAEKPADYLKIIASLVPRDINLNPPGLEDMSDDDLQDALDEVRNLATFLALAKKPN